MNQLRNGQTGGQGVPSSNNKGGFAFKIRDEANPIELVNELQKHSDRVEAARCRALEHMLATQIGEEFPTVKTLVFWHLEDPWETIPWMMEALDESGQRVDDDIEDVLRNDYLQGLDRDMGTWLEGAKVDLYRARDRDYVFEG